MNILIIGCGYLGQTVAASLRSKESVFCTKTTPLEGAKAPFFTLLDPSSYAKIPHLIKDMDVIIVTASAGASKSYYESYLILARRLKKALEGYHDKTIIYASSTGVYRESAGKVCQEGSPLDLNRAHILIDAEKTYLSITNHRIVVLRFSGLFGDKRPLKRLYQVYTSLALCERDANFIHIDQAAYAILYAVNHPIRGVYNVSKWTIKNTKLFEILFKIPPPLITQDASFSRHGGSKKVSNLKLLLEPGFKFPERSLD